MSNSADHIKQFEYADFIQDNLKLNFDHPYFFANEVIFKRLSKIYFPYRNFFHGIGVIHEGEAELFVGAERYPIQPHHIITIGPGILR